MTAYLNTYSFIIALGIVAIIIEILIGAATGFELLVLGVILVISGFIGSIIGSVQITIGLIVVLTFLYIIIGRKKIKDSLHITTHATNTDQIIGKSAKVVLDITPDEPGQIKIAGEIWRAEAEKPIKKGESVIIQSVSGVTVKVE